jgi:dTDP-4-amino-4,6-dideoxygalactose transaminase
MTDSLPVVLGGSPLVADRVPLVRPTIEDVPGLTEELGRVVASGMLTNGPQVRRLEEAVAERLGVPHVVALSSCTAGLMLVYQALDATGRVVLPSFTFAASGHAVRWAGGTPVWADVEEHSLSLDPGDAAAVLDGAVALSATHIYGRPAEVEALEALAGERGIPLVFDAAHGLGSLRRGRPVGTFGTAEVFSLSPTKVAVAGEGGLVATSDEGLAARLRIGRDYGNPGTYDTQFVGLNARMSELHATIGLASLVHLDERIARRNALVRSFQRATDGVPGISYQQVDEGDVSTYKDLTLVVEAERFGLDAATLGRALAAEGIDSRHYYAPPIHRQKAYADLPAERELPVTERLAERVITVPLHSHLPGSVVLAVAESVVRIHRHAPEVVAALP